MKKLPNNDLKQLIESIIFVSSTPVTVKELSHYFKEHEAKDLRKLLKEITTEYQEKNRGFELVEISNGFQFRSKPEFAEEIVNFNKEIKKFRLSKASLEVIAIVAYKQPITRVEVEQIRGVDCSGVINLLLDKRLLDIKGRKDVPGKPFLYGTTDEFLETFNLKSLKELPTLKEIEDLDGELEFKV